MIREYLQQLSARERSLVYAAVGLVAALLVWMMIIEPVQERRAALEEIVERTRSTHQAIVQAAKEARQLRTGGTTVRQPLATQSLVGSVDETARRFGLAAQMKRVEPSGQENVSVWLEKVSFDTLSSWIEEMEGRHGLRVQTMEAERVEAGLVNARVILGP
ncbi:MAG: type II secretion system protein M [Gammaproteobacteria bacterium]|nr:type II secretion system protein M [Gammaproteobacteria bacterium]